MRFGSISGAANPSAARFAASSGDNGESISETRPLPKRCSSTSTSPSTTEARVRAGSHSTTRPPGHGRHARIPAGRPDPPKASSNFGKASVTSGKTAKAMIEPSYTVAPGNARIASALMFSGSWSRAYERPADSRVRQTMLPPRANTAASTAARCSPSTSLSKLKVR